MKNFPLAPVLLAASMAAAQAAPNDGIVGSYFRVDVGRSSFSLPVTPPRSTSDEHGLAVKVFGGYRFDNGLGLELGYASLGSFSETARVNGVSVKQDGRARSVFGVATSRLPLGESFALHSRLGLSSGKVSGTNLLPPSDDLTGEKTSVMFGLGAEYRPTANVALTLSFDRYGNVSNKVKASSMLFGLHIGL